MTQEKGKHSKQELKKYTEHRRKQSRAYWRAQITGLRVQSVKSVIQNTK